MKVSNDPGANGPGDQQNSAFAELFQLQSEFQNRLADETLRYLRRLQGTAAPASPGTVVIPQGSDVLAASGAPGQSVEIVLEVENLQRVHACGAPMISPLVSSAGITWYPQADYYPANLLIAPGATRQLRVTVAIPDKLPAGSYRGCLNLEGFSKSALPLVIESVIAGPAMPSKTHAAARKPAPSKKKAASPKPAKSWRKS